MAFTASVTSVALPRTVLGALGTDFLRVPHGLTWGWMGRFAPPTHRPRFVRVSGSVGALRRLQHDLRVVIHDRTRSLSHRQAAFHAYGILHARLGRLTADT